MGGAGNLLLPVGERRMSSWTAHQYRTPRSEEPGTDFYCPIGTPVLAPDDGVIYGYGNSIVPSTGRWVGIQFQSGMSFRAMHFSRIVRTSGVVRRGEIIGYSGASGYGDEDWSWNPNTGGAHTHVTLWPTAVRRFGYSPTTGKPYTIDFMNFVGGSPAGGGGTTPTIPEINLEPDNMERLMQIDPQVNGAWYRVNYSQGTAVKIDNGYQLDRAREEVTWDAGKPQPRIIEMGGPQPTSAIAKLTIINP